MNSLRIFKKNLCYQLIKQKNLLKRSFSSRAPNKYLFILSPPFSGSTLLNEIIDSSYKVSCNNPYGTKEGQFLPEVKALLWNKENFNPELDIDWAYISKIWHRYWDVTKPVLLEKSPSNLVRALDIQKNFQGVYFICLVRDPYSLVEGFLRRSIIYKTPSEAAAFVVECFRFQKSNVEALENKLLLRYEDIVENREITRDRLIEFIPDIHPIFVDGEFKAHNIRGGVSKIHNFNLEKVRRLEQSQLNEINKVFCKYAELIRYFGYNIYSDKDELLEAMESSFNLESD